MMLTIITIFMPIILGLILLCQKEGIFSRQAICIYSGAVLVVDFVLIVICLITMPEGKFTLLSLTDSLAIEFTIDNLGRLFAIIMSLVWVLAGFYSFEYMKHEKNNRRFYAFYVMLLGILMGLCFAANIITYYTFFEFMTLASFALVLHNQSAEAVMASYKYMFYSFAGAYLVLFGIFFVKEYSVDRAMTFSYGGIIDYSLAEKSLSVSLNGLSANGGILSLALLTMIIGFSVKAGMFPMHGWLPSAHPVAPAPASAVLSGIIVKAGVLGIVRTIFYVFGVDFFSGSYVQKLVLSFSLITVFMGSMLAFREPVFKKRLAYSTVSQVSYILFGIFILNETAFEGAMLHVVAHAAIKSVLFMCAGTLIYITGCTKVAELRGIGKKMPVMLWCYTIASLGLIGIPPFGGFTSKWYLCIGALQSNMKVFAWAGPVVLLVSALLTAGYLLPITIDGFLPGKDFITSKEAEEGAFAKAHEPVLIMLVPIVLLTLISIIVGVFPEVLTCLI